MKKQGLLKRIALGLTAGAMIVAMLPASIASAETTDGSYWETITDLNFTGFSELPDPSTSRWTSMKATKTVDGVTYGIEFMPGGSTPIGNNTGYITYESNKWGWDDSLAFLSNDLPVSLNDALARIRRTCTADVYWQWSGPTQALRVSNIYGANEVNAGDRIKVTAYVNTNGTQYWNPVTGKGLDPNDSDLPLTKKSGVRMWLSQKKDDSVGLPEYYPQNPMGMINVEEYTRQIVDKQKWCEVSLEYNINSYTKDVKAIRIDNGLLDEENTSVYDYPREMFIAKLKVEKLSPAGGTYSIDETGKLSGSVKAGINENPSEDAKAKIIVAAYQDSTFLGCSISDYTSGGSYNFEIDNVNGANDVMAYIWYMNNIEPKIRPITLTAQ